MGITTGEKINLSRADLKILSEYALKNGREHLVIPLLLEWMEAAEAEVIRLRTLLKEEQ